MTLIKIPPDASINVQDSFRDVRDALRGIESRLDSLASNRISEADIALLKSAVVELAKKPTYRTWEDVFGNFPRVDNLFAPFLITKGNVSTGEQVLAQKEFDPKELAVGKGYRGLFWGKIASNANAKTIRVRVLEGQTNTILNAFSLTVNVAGHWFLVLRIIRVSEVSLRAVVALLVGASGSPTGQSFANVTQPAATFNNKLIIQVTGEAVATNDITIEGGVLPRIEPTLEVFSSTVGNVGAGEDTLQEKILRTGELISNGQSIRGIFWGKCASNANVKTLRLRIIEGANDSVLVSAVLTPSEAGHWALSFEMLRVGAATLQALGQINEGPSNTVLSRSNLNVSTITATLANAVTIRVTGDATTTDDITCEGGVILPPVNTISTVQSTVGNVGAGEDTLAETILGASGVQFNLSADGMTVRGLYWGKTTSNANVKTLRARLIEGGNNTVLVSMAPTVNEAGRWALGFEIIRKDVSTLLAVAQTACGPANTSISASTPSVTQPPATLANAITLRITGEAVSDNDITVEGGTLSFVL